MELSLSEGKDPISLDLDITGLPQGNLTVEVQIVITGKQDAQGQFTRRSMHCKEVIVNSFEEEHSIAPPIHAQIVAEPPKTMK